MKKGLLIAVSGFSGAGKGTVMKELLATYPEYALSISATTRSPRKGEEEGVHYFFKTNEEFQRMIAEDQFIEHVEYVGHCYGTPKAYVEKMRSEGKNILLEIEVQGAISVKKKYPETVLVFVFPPSLEELVRRLTERGTETKEVIRHRLEQIERELNSAKEYDYVLVNDDLKECTAMLHKIVMSEQCRISRNEELFEKISESAKKMLQ